MRHCYACNKSGVPIKNALCERCAYELCRIGPDHVPAFQRGPVRCASAEQISIDPLERQRQTVREILMDKETYKHLI